MLTTSRWVRVLGIALAAPLVHAQDQAPADPLYRVEIILYANLEGNRAEEDLHHGDRLALDAPRPSRLDLPALGLESLDDIDDPADRAQGGGELPTASQTTDPTLQNPAFADAGSETEPIARDGLELIETLPDSSAAAGARSRQGSELPGGFRVLSRDELELGELDRRLRSSRPYRVLAHAGWEQAGVDSERSIPIDLSRLGITNPTGTMTLILSRFLRLTLDLDFHDGTGSLWRIPAGSGIEPLLYAETFKLETGPLESPTIRSGELWYTDHPLFGVIVLIRPAPPPESGDAARRGPAG